MYAGIPTCWGAIPHCVIILLDVAHEKGVKEAQDRRVAMLTLAQTLMLAVLDQAVADLQSPSLKVRRQALAWFLTTGTGADHLFSFPRICQEFGREPATVRRRVLANGSDILHEARDELQRAAS
jgi:hypothetical protein